MNIAILILAAGNSSRMKQPKQLLPVGNSTLINMAIKNALSIKASNVFCVLGAHFEDIKNSISHFDIDIIQNKDYHTGLSSSIVKGLKEIMPHNYDAVLVLLADQPKINSDYLDTLIKQSTLYPHKIIASIYNSNYGVPAIFPKHYFNQLLALKGDKGAKEILNSNLNDIKGVETKGQLIDIDTKEDYLNFLNNIQS